VPGITAANDMNTTLPSNGLAIFTYSFN